MYLDSKGGALDKLKIISGVKFDLPLNDQTTEALESLVGIPKSRLYIAGHTKLVAVNK